MRQAEASCIDARGRHEASIKAVQGAILQATANAADIVSLTYDAERESVTMKFENGGSRIVNVAMDSGTAMIRDVMANLGC